MTCHSCELMVERSWKDLPGVKSVKADSQSGTVKVVSEKGLDRNQLQESLLDQKYRVAETDDVKDGKPDQSRPSWSELTGLFALAIGLAWVITRLGGLVSGGQASENIGLGTALFLGVLASMSSCLAVVSGLLISSTASVASSSNKLSVRLAPVLMFLTGRVGSYALLGGFLGWMGARLAFSSTTTALVLAVAAVYMILVGLDMLHLLPSSIRRYLPGTPKSLSHGVLNRAQRAGAWLPFVMGAATFFLPCGFTQALQAYALTTGSFTASAVILGAFAIGTVPGLLLFGLATASFKGSAGKFVLKVAGALVIVLGLLNLRNGVALAGISLPAWHTGDQNAVSSVVDAATQEQVVKMTATDSGYVPNGLSVKVGIPVRWEIDDQARGCAGTIVASSLGINAVLKPGLNVLRFTPQRTGTIRFSCSMGMYTGQFEVTGTAAASGDGSVQPSPYFMRQPSPPVVSGQTCGASGGCGCGGGGAPVVPDEAPAPSIEAAPSGAGVQVFKTTFDVRDDLQPNTFTVKANQPVEIDIDAKEDGAGCMSTITIPGLYDQVMPIRQGQMRLEFTPTRVGTYDITCAMGVPRGKVIVE